MRPYYYMHINSSNSVIQFVYKQWSYCEENAISSHYLGMEISQNNSFSKVSAAVWFGLCSRFRSSEFEPSAGRITKMFFTLGCHRNLITYTWAKIQILHIRGCTFESPKSHYHSGEEFKPCLIFFTLIFCSWVQ